MDTKIRRGELRMDAHVFMRLVHKGRKNMFRITGFITRQHFDDQNNVILISQS